MADRDRRAGLRQPVRHRPAADQAGLGRHPAARASRRRSSTPDGEPLPAGEKGIVVDQAAVPRADRRASGASPSATGATTGRASRAVYFTGDAAHVDEDGYVWFAGRADEIIKIAGHRIGTIEVETAFLRHPAVAEAGVTGRPDELRGEVISAFVVLQAGPRRRPEALRRELLERVRRELGAGGGHRRAQVRRMLPKTRSGKIMRRVFKAVVLGSDPGDISTIEDEGSVEEARHGDGGATGYGDGCARLNGRRAARPPRLGPSDRAVSTRRDA